MNLTTLSNQWKSATTGAEKAEIISRMGEILERGAELERLNEHLHRVRLGLQAKIDVMKMDAEEIPGFEVTREALNSLSIKTDKPYMEVSDE